MRWVVKRTHVWNERVHRLIMHHDRNIPIAVASVSGWPKHACSVDG
jgi:hypothetical protein